MLTNVYFFDVLPLVSFNGWTQKKGRNLIAKIRNSANRFLLTSFAGVTTVKTVSTRVSKSVSTIG
jgi:hypothetical protein